MMYGVYPIDILHVNDNYIWAITPDNSRQAYVVDPGAAEPVEQWLETNGRQLAGILITHHHWDHVTGVPALVQRHSVPVWGPGNCISEITEVVGEGDRISCNNIEFQVMAIPGHTRDHIAYYTTSGTEPALFCGDTLFAAGCGRVLGGTIDQLYESLGRLAQLPPETQIYCAHEYTLTNLAFAAQAEPGNPAIKQRQEFAQSLRNQGKPSLPTQLSKELATNPFLRCRTPEVVANASAWCGHSLQDSREVFTALRRWKDNF